MSYAKNLGDGDTDVQPDVHLRDLAAETTTPCECHPRRHEERRVRPPRCRWTPRARVSPSIRTPATLPGGGGAQSQVYVRDLAADTLELASRADGPDGAPGTGQSGGPVISPEGGYVAFLSQAPNLSPGIPAGAAETYVRDLSAGRTELVSRESGADGRLATGVASPSDVSAGAGCVSFVSKDALIGPDSDYPQVYLRVRRADCDTGAPDVRDTTAPVLSGARLSRRRFRVGRARTPLAARLRPGTVLRFRSTRGGHARRSRAVLARHRGTRAARAHRHARRPAAGRRPRPRSASPAVGPRVDAAACDRAQRPRGAPCDARRALPAHAPGARRGGQRLPPGAAADSGSLR